MYEEKEKEKKNEKQELKILDTIPKCSFTMHVAKPPKQKHAKAHVVSKGPTSDRLEACIKPQFRSHRIRLKNHQKKPGPVAEGQIKGGLKGRRPGV